MVTICTPCRKNKFTPGIDLSVSFSPLDGITEFYRVLQVILCSTMRLMIDISLMSYVVVDHLANSLYLHRLL